MFHDFLDVIHETHIEHPVGFVEDEVAHLAELHVAQLQVRDQAPRRGHHDVGPLRERLLLLIE